MSSVKNFSKKFLKSFFSCLAIKGLFFFFYLFLVISYPAQAIVYKNINIQIQEKNVRLSIESAVRLVLDKYISFNAAQKEIIFQNEIKPYIYETVPSYKVLKSKKTADADHLLSVGAEINMMLLHSFFIFSKNYLKGNLKAVIAVKGHEGGSPWRNKEYSEAEENLVMRIQNSIKTRLEHRSFNVLAYDDSEQSYVEEDFNIKSTFKNIASRKDSNIVIYIEPSFLYIRKKPRNIRQMHFQIKSKLYERSSNSVLSEVKKSIPLWQAKRAILSKNQELQSKINDFIDYSSYNLFREAGIKYLKSIQKSPHFVLRVLEPPDYQFLQELKQYLLDKVPDIEEIVERELKKGSLDYWIKISQEKEKDFIKIVRDMNLENYLIAVDDLAQERIISVRFIGKKSQKEEISNEIIKKSSKR